ncbi:MAG: WYL domain-containing protein [Bacteroidaceae bacterium]|nr:WYL domain-containing protein [Bacteroidaceae bacterium]
MPTNKNALLRYQILDRCFSDFNRKYEIQDLVDKVNDALSDLYGTEVSTRQIRDDIKYMRDRLSYNAPIEAIPYDGKKCYYRYTDPHYSIFNNELTTEEITTLRSTIEMLSRFRDGSKNAWLEEVISNLEYRFGVKANAENVVSFEQNEQLRGLHFLGDLIEAAIHHQPLQMLYRSYYGVEHNTIVHPYHLKQFNNRWFLLGVEETDLGTRLTNKALDRIVKFTPANVPFLPNTDIDFKEYFKDVVGVTVLQEHPTPETIILKFDEARFPYIVTKPLHPSQQVIHEDACILQITVRPNKELEALIFSFGPQVEVLEPQWLRTQFQEKLALALNNYSTVKKDCTENDNLCNTDLNKSC